MFGKKKKETPLIEIIRAEFESRLWSLGLRIGKLEHQRNEARRKHGVLKRKVRQHGVMRELGVVEKLQKRVEELENFARIREAEMIRVQQNAANQNQVLMDANRALRARINDLTTGQLDLETDFGSAGKGIG